MADEWRPEQLPGERTARWNRNQFPGGLEGESPQVSPVEPTFRNQDATIRGSTSAVGSPTILFAYDFIVVP